MITCIDDAIANITQALSDAGLWENSVLIFSSGNYKQELSESIRAGPIKE